MIKMFFCIDEIKKLRAALLPCRLFTFYLDSTVSLVSKSKILNLQLLPVATQPYLTKD